MRRNLLALSALSSSISFCSDNRGLSPHQQKPVFISAINGYVLKDPAFKPKTGLNTCCSYISTQRFNDENKFFLMFDANCLPFFLWGQQLMYLVTNDFTDKLKPDYFDFDFLISKQRTGGMKVHFVSEGFIEATDRAADLLQLPQMETFIGDICNNNTEKVEAFISQQATVKRQKFFANLKFQIMYWHHYCKINESEIQQHLVRPIGEAQFSFGLENMHQIFIVNANLSLEDKSQLTDFITKLTQERQILLSDEGKLTKYCQTRLKQLVKYKRDAVLFLKEIAENPNKHPNFSSKIPKNCSDDLPSKISKQIEEIERDVATLTKYYNDKQNVANDLAKKIIIYWQNKDGSMQEVVDLTRFSGSYVETKQVSYIALAGYVNNIYTSR